MILANNSNFAASPESEGNDANVNKSEQLSNVFPTPSLYTVGRIFTPNIPSETPFQKFRATLAVLRRDPNNSIDVTKIEPIGGVHVENGNAVGRENVNKNNENENINMNYKNQEQKRRNNNTSNVTSIPTTVTPTVTMTTAATVTTQETTQDPIVASYKGWSHISYFKEI